MTPSTVTTTRIAAANRLLTASIQPIAIPLWYGCEVPGVDLGALVLRDGLQLRWISPQYVGLRNRLRPAITIPVAELDDARKRIDQRNMTFKSAIDDANTALANAVDAAIEHGHLALTLGGDHAVAMGSIGGAARHATKLGVLWIDTHPDLNTPESSFSGHIHGMPLGTAIGLAPESMRQASLLAGQVPMIQPEHICLLGIRDIDAREEEVIAEKDIFTRTMDEWNDEGILPGLEAALNHLQCQGVDAIHLSFDLDVLDPAFMPGTGTRYPGGLTVREASQVLRYLGAWEGPIRSMDLVELNPTLDNTGYSTDIALHLLATALGERMLGRG
jgi:arginase